MKLTELKSIDEKTKAFSFELDEDESIEILSFKEKRCNFLIKKE